MHPGPITRLVARAPTTREDGLHFASPARDSPTTQGTHMRHQARIPHHKRHQLGRITADIEKLETRMLDRFTKGEMCGETDAVTVGFEDFP